MDEVSRAYVKQFADMRSALSKRAESDVLKAYDLLDDDDLENALYDLITSYVRQSSAVTARFYNGIRTASRVGSKYNARTFNIGGAINDDIRAIISDAEQPDKQLANLINRYIKNASDETVRRNARLDPAKPKYAMVPSGDACAFCQMRASLGYNYADASAVESHNHCTCTAVPVFGNQKVQGYDPDVYAEKYYDAVHALDSGDIPDELKAKIDAEKAIKPDFDKTNAVLMVMRYQQGIK